MTSNERIVRHSSLQKFLQHLAQPRDSFADVFLARAAEADAHFVVRFCTCRVVGVAQFAGNVEHVILQRGQGGIFI